VYQDVENATPLCIIAVTGLVRDEGLTSCVLVIGARIIGSIYSWALAESGHHIVHLVLWQGFCSERRSGARRA
jgi:hypothetical protein